MGNNWDKHIDTKVKESFDAFQKKVPLQLWQNIFEQLDTDQNFDEQLDQKVQHTYQNELKGAAPALVWNAIEAKLNVDALVDEKVKTSFQTNRIQSAPMSLWSSISNDLDDKMPVFDPLLDEKVKASFWEQEEIKTPNKVWFAINRQLNIDKTWISISKVLDANPIISDWRKRMLQFMTVAVLCLFFARTCNYNPYPRQGRKLVVNKTIVSSHNLPNKEENKFVLEKHRRLEKHQEKPEGREDFREKELQKQEDKKTVSSNQSEKELMAAVTNSKKIALKEQENNTNSVLPIVGVVTNAKWSDRISKEKDSLDKATKNSDSKIIVAEHLVSRVANNKATDTSEKPIGFSENNAEMPPPDWAFLETIRIEQLPTNFETEPIQLMDGLKLKKGIKKSSIEGKLEAGAFIVVNSTMLLNNETREGFDANSLTTNYFGLAANYGIWTAYNVSSKGSIVAEFSINADNKQAYGTYEKGLFYIKEWVMKYNRFSVAYKHDLWSSDSDKLINTKVVAQGGCYVGVMREAKLFYDGVLVFDKLADYHQFDFGLKLVLGQELLIDKFVVGYGIRSDIGLANIFRGNTLLNAQENQTNIIHLGGYVALGYRF